MAFVLQVLASWFATRALLRVVPVASSLGLPAAVAIGAVIWSRV
ncbi:MAG: hypothetical protein WAU41_03105 [Gaiellaceae bacterium]